MATSDTAKTTDEEATLLRRLNLYKSVPVRRNDRIVELHGHSKTFSTTDEAEAFHTIYRDAATRILEQLALALSRGEFSRRQKSMDDQEIVGLAILYFKGGDAAGRYGSHDLALEEAERIYRTRKDFLYLKERGLLERLD